MDVIWHDDVAAHQKVVCFVPCIDQQSVCLLVCQDWLTLFCADGDKDDARAISLFMDRLLSGAGTVR